MTRLLLALIALATPALAEEPTCNSRETVLSLITGPDYAEVPIGRGRSAAGVLMEIYANPQTGTWTIVMTGPDGTSCFGSAGTGDFWELARRPPNA